MFGSLGGPELVLILVIALIVFGPRRLPDIGKSMGKMLMEFRRASNEFKRTVEDEVESEKRAEGARLAPPAASGTAPTVDAAGTEPAPSEPAPAPAVSESAVPLAGTVAQGSTAPPSQPM
jgi:TatA/E family protein of Tat protein translocase